MFTQRQARDEALFKPGSRHQCHPVFQERPVGFAGHISSVHDHPAVDRSHQARASLKQDALTAAFHAGQANDLAFPHRQIHIFNNQSVVFER